ncbi:sushi, von Willebrand factor type A, EGF and pentraxin domain-containing protein 1 [Lampris incognitus]|uniref:sushi, von Willebrand factor type A, EGF and pentraxin domain-containing protein 1 n=1 Tax=Lampris incognitus TaxID=2546036 RepID=UPI0024B56056|nr:sushi, von Willebrand factor type A, EGF and pentraxin domain-containing protein 1 [Lampris incognitus]
MKSVGGNLVLLAFATYVSAQFSKECGRPPGPHQHSKIYSRYALRQKFKEGEKVYYDCAEDYTPSKGSRAVQCIKGKWTVLTLKCEKKSCGNAGDLFNGQFIYEENSYLGDKVHAVCDDGYTLKGAKYMICKHSGWSGEFPSCEESGAVDAAETTCSDPAVANSMKIRGDVLVYQIGESVIITCNPGFHLAGSQKVNCGPDGQWQPQLPHCLPSDDTSCKEPKAQLDNKFTIISGLKHSYKHGDSLSFSCNGTYFLNGSTSSTCGPNGRWTPPLPTCKMMKCRQLSVPHGRLSTGHRRVNSVVTVTCHRGYQRKGPSEVVCLKDGKWSETLKCVSEKEANTFCSSPEVANGSKSSGDVQEYQLGASVTFTCHPGFQLSGSQQVTCGPAGQWQPQLPNCLPISDGDQQSSKKDGRCGVPAHMSESNAQLADSYIAMTSFASGERVHYVCEIGYVPAGGSRYRSCVEGTWTPLLLKCERKSCGSAGEIISGYFEYSGAEFGDTAIAKCNEGYRLVGQETRRCRSDGWDGRIPRCEAPQCEEPPEVQNAGRIGAMSPPYMYGHVINYRCRVGMFTGPKQIWCTKDGTWSSPLPECQELTCPSPKVPNSFRTGAVREPYKYRDATSFECNWGYVMVGWSTVTCGADGRWSPRLPECRLSDQPSILITASQH